MIDRSYLPYQSARDFQDRGMAKWAGFFLSEHSTALQTKPALFQRASPPLKPRNPSPPRASLPARDLPLPLYPPDNQVAVYYGQVYTLSPSEVLIKNGQHYHSLLLSTIFSIEPGDSSYETSPE